MSTVTSLLARQIECAIEAIPAAHREAPTHGDVVADPEVAFRRIQDWAFTQGYAFVIESTTDIRVRFECVHHKNNTKNCRKIRRTASVLIRRFAGQSILAVKKDVEINGYCAIQSTQSIITLLPLILFSFHLIVIVALAMVKQFKSLKHTVELLVLQHHRISLKS
jgi:hypothetical protein